MTISTTSNRERYSGNASTTVFAYNFKINDDDDLTVIVADADDAQTTLTKTTHYTVSDVGEDAGGDVTLGDLTSICGAAALPATWTVTILRVVDIKQLTDLQNQGGFFAETHEDVFDYVTMIAQQQQEEIDRSFKTSETSGLTGDELQESLDNAVDDAQAAQVAAEAAQTAAETAETNAEASETAASSAETAAETAQTAAEAARDLAQEYANDLEINVTEYTASGSETYVDVSGYVLASSLDNIQCTIDGVDQLKSSLTRTSDTRLTLGGALTAGQVVEIRSASFNASATSEAAAAASAASTSASEAAASAASVDIPTSLTGETGKTLKVNATETGYDLVTPQDLPTISSGDANKVVTVKSDESGVEYTTLSAGDKNPDQVHLLRSTDLVIGDIDLTGNNAAFDGGGTITASSLSLSTTSADLILTDSVIKYDPDADGSDDYFGFSKAIPQGQRGRFHGFAFDYKNDSTTNDDDFRFCVKIKDGADAGTVTYFNMAAYSPSDDEATKFAVVCFISTDCTEVEFGWQNTDTTTTVELMVDNILVTAKPHTPNNVSARITQDGASASITSQGCPNNPAIASVSRVSAGVTQINFTSGYYTVVPSVSGTVESAGEYMATTTPDTSGVRMQQTNHAGTGSDYPFTIRLGRQGADWFDNY